MDIILVHLGSAVPKYMNDCIRQIRKFTNEKVWVIVEKPFQYVSEEKNVHTVTAFEQSGTFSYIPKNYKKFLEIDFFHNKDLWRYSCERFYAIEHFMFDNQIEKALHLEYDNLIYYAPYDMQFDCVYGDAIALPRITDRFLSAGIMYIGSIGALIQMNKALNDLMEAGPQYLDRRSGGEMINEMHLLGMVFDDQTAPIKELPILPGFANRFVFDGASWGQWIGGTHQNPGSPWAEDRHIVGSELLKLRYDVIWKDGAPYILEKSDGYQQMVPLFNLHIHSKELEKWSNVDKHK